MYSPHLVKPFAVITSSVCVVQALVWTVCSFLAILVGTCTIEISPETNYVADLFRGTLGYYIQGKCGSPNTPLLPGLLTPEGILISMSFYLVTSLLWLAASSMLLSAFLQGEMKYQMNLLYFWIGTTAVTCVIDFVMTIMYGLDYSTINQLPAKINNTVILTVAATMMALAAKGFILWIFNVSALVYFIRVAYFLREEQKYNTGRSMSRQPSLRSIGYHPPQAVNNVERKRMEQMWRDEPNVQSPTIGSASRVPWPREEPRQYPQSFGSVHEQWPREEPLHYQNDPGQQNVPRSREPPRQYPQSSDPSRGPWTTSGRPPSVQDEFAHRPPPMNRPTHALPRIPIPVATPQVPKPLPKPDYSPPQQHKRYEPRMFDQPHKSAIRKPPPFPPAGRTLF